MGSWELLSAPLAVRLPAVRSIGESRHQDAVTTAKAGLRRAQPSARRSLATAQTTGRWTCYRAPAPHVDEVWIMSKSLIFAAAATALVASPVAARHRHHHDYSYGYSSYSPYGSYGYSNYGPYPGYGYTAPGYGYSYPGYGYSYPSYGYRNYGYSYRGSRYARYRQYGYEHRRHHDRDEGDRDDD